MSALPQIPASDSPESGRHAGGSPSPESVRLAGEFIPDAYCVATIREDGSMPGFDQVPAISHFGNGMADVQLFIYRDFLDAQSAADRLNGELEEEEFGVFGLAVEIVDRWFATPERLREPVLVGRDEASRSHAVAPEANE